MNMNDPLLIGTLQLQTKEEKEAWARLVAKSKVDNRRLKLLAISPELMMQALKTPAFERLAVSQEGLPDDAEVVGCEWDKDNYGRRTIVLIIRSGEFDPIEESDLPPLKSIPYLTVTFTRRLTG